MADNCTDAAVLGGQPPSTSTAEHSVRIRAMVKNYLADHSAAVLEALPYRQICRRRYFYYRGDENYGLGNVLYDVASAFAFAMVLNRTFVYGANSSDRKFGSLLRWAEQDGKLATLSQIEDLRRRSRCGAGPLAKQRRLLLAADKCTYHRIWRKERSGRGRCLQRMLGAELHEDRPAMIELSKACTQELVRLSA